MSFGRQKTKTFSGTSPHQGPATDPLGGLQQPPPPRAPPAFCATRVSCSYNLGAFGATDVDFFSVLTHDMGSHLASSVSKFFILEGTRDHIIAPIKDSVSVSYCTVLTLYVLKVWLFRKLCGCSVSWNNSHIKFGAILCFTL